MKRNALNIVRLVVFIVSAVLFAASALDIFYAETPSLYGVLGVAITGILLVLLITNFGMKWATRDNLMEAPGHADVGSGVDA